MSVSKGIFMCLLLGVIKIADMNVNAKIWFPGQQIKPLGPYRERLTHIAIYMFTKRPFSRVQRQI